MTDSIPIDDLPSAMDSARRDRYGRYLVVPPYGGDPIGYTRVTVVAKALDSGGGLASWKAAMAAQGIVMRRGLRAQWEALMASTSGNPWYAGEQAKAATKRLVEDCAAVGGANDRAEMGTSLHTITALIDVGRTPAHLTDETERDVKAYQSGMKEAGITVLPGMVEVTVVLDDYVVAGTFDRLVQVPGFELPLIADLKTGGNLSYSWQSIAVQMAAYSRADFIYRQGTARNGAADERLPMPEVDQRYGLILWLNADTAHLELFLVELEAGWEGFEHSMWTRGWRNRDVAFRLDELKPDLSVPVPAVAERPVDLAPLLEASVENNERSKRRAWLQERIEAIGGKPEARELLANLWDRAIPTLRSSTEHTAAQLDAIEELLNEVEAEFRMPFGPEHPLTERPLTEDEATDKVFRLFPNATAIITNHQQEQHQQKRKP